MLREASAGFLLVQPDAAKEVGESGIGAEGVKTRINFQMDHP